MRDIFISGLILIAGIINVIPVMGVLSRATLEALYGITLDNPNLEILMRHRAVMFGLLGGFMIFAGLTQTYRLLAIIGGLMSMTLFVGLAYQVGDFSAHIAKINKADFIGIACLGVALVLIVWK